jgi:hypothetical protein
VLWQAADRLAGERRHQKGDDVGGGLTVPSEGRAFRAVASEEPLERLDLARCRAREEERGPSDGLRGVATAAPTPKEPFATPDALIEGAEPTLKGRLASDDPRRDWDADAT